MGVGQYAWRIDIGSALRAMAYLSRNEEDKTDLRRYLLGHIEHLNDRIRTDAIRALGDLGDSKAVPILESVASINPDGGDAKAAQDAIKAIRETNTQPVGLNQIRQEVLDLQKQLEALRKQIK